ncbi:hypothetical protein B0I35DRAFT_6377 [Stachybotrys elegans]|uniref:Secreted protein n=1 Tax=Stachybotrys elegans TaxID=80388 RepID=A0A8K0WVV8_9HYPO|nr:hypothetical protein B0I35DRAFT_6377 [Stachybotrys elegans]
MRRTVSLCLIFLDGAFVCTCCCQSSLQCLPPAPGRISRNEQTPGCQKPAPYPHRALERLYIDDGYLKCIHCLFPPSVFSLPFTRSLSKPEIIVHYRGCTCRLQASLAGRIAICGPVFFGHRLPTSLHFLSFPSSSFPQFPSQSSLPLLSQLSKVVALNFASGPGHLSLESPLVSGEVLLGHA